MFKVGLKQVKVYRERWIEMRLDETRAQHECECGVKTRWEERCLYITNAVADCDDVVEAARGADSYYSSAKD